MTTIFGLRLCVAVLISTAVLFTSTTTAEDIDGYWAFSDSSIEKIMSNYIEELKDEIEDPESIRGELENTFRNQYRRFETIGENKVIVTILFGHKSESAETGKPGITQYELLFEKLGTSDFKISNDQNPLMQGSVSKNQMDYTDIETGLEIKMRKVTRSELEMNLTEFHQELLKHTTPDGFIEPPEPPIIDPGDFFVTATLDKEPKIKESVPPVYPPELKRERIEGEVVLVFVVDEAGRARKIDVESSTDERFNQAAIEAVEATLFEPGEKDGKLVKTRIKLPISFTLRR